MGRGGERENSGRPNKWGFPSDTHTVIRIPKEILNALIKLREHFKGQELVSKLMSLLPNNNNNNK